MMTSNDMSFDKICRFCGYEKNIGKFIFSSEAAKIGLLSKIKQLFPGEIELISAEVILPKFICNTCETTIDYFFEFYNAVKLVQENLKKKALSDKSSQHERIADVLYQPQHLCQEKQGFVTISFDSAGSVSCNDCSKKLNLIELHKLRDGPSYVICNDCGYKDEMYIFLPEKNDELSCPRCPLIVKKTIQNTSVKLKEKEFKCDVCGKIFRSKGHLNRHCLTHFGAKPYLCENCGTGFNQKSTLKTHTLIHKKVTPFSCKWCGQPFRHKQTLLNHVMSIHGFISDVGSLYECDKCKKRFINKAKLRRHYRCHSGEKPFKCNICDKTFTQNVNLKTHYKKHETESQFPMSMYSSPSDLNATERGELIQELFTDCQQLNLNLDSIPAETDENFNTGIQKSYTNNRDINLKNSDNSGEMYFMSTSYDLMYSNNTDLYNTDDDVCKSSMLPTFSALNTVT